MAAGLETRVAQRLARLVAPGEAVCVGFSGGLDSTVLLHVLAGLREARGLALSALHVHHGLSPNADRWASACEAFARERAVPLRVERVSVDPSHPGGPEAAAREARHAAFARCGAPVVALAHHRDDQAETVLLQALRGTGVKGLAAMGESRAAGDRRWIRPLLAERRETLLAYANGAGLAWVEDESNALADFDRNFLRHEVLPLLERRFPQATQSLARLARHAAEADALLEALAGEDAARLAAEGGLEASGLAALAPARRALVLRRFLAAHGLAMPGEARLAEIARQLAFARGDARVLLPHDGRVLVRHRGRVRVEAPPAAGGWEVAWRGESVLSLGGDRGEVRFSPASGEGIAAEHAAGDGWRFAPRAGGERLRLRPDGPTRTLKNLLQEHAVPAWARAGLPLLFHGARLVWVPGVGVAADYRAAAGGPGLVPGWHREGPPASFSGPRA